MSGVWSMHGLTSLRCALTTPARVLYEFSLVVHCQMFDSEGYALSAACNKVDGWLISAVFLLLSKFQECSRRR